MLNMLQKIGISFSTKYYKLNIRQVNIEKWILIQKTKKEPIYIYYIKNNGFNFVALKPEEINDSTIKEMYTHALTKTTINKLLKEYNYVK